MTSIYGCPVNTDLDACSKTVRPSAKQCALLTTTAVNAKGTTRLRVQLGTFVTRGRSLTLFTDAGPMPFVVLLENQSGSKQWKMSTPIVLRPTIDYALEYTAQFGFGTLEQNVRGPIAARHRRARCDEWLSCASERRRRNYGDRILLASGCRPTARSVSRFCDSHDVSWRRSRRQIVRHQQSTRQQGRRRIRDGVVQRHQCR